MRRLLVLSTAFLIIFGLFAVLQAGDGGNKHNGWGQNPHDDIFTCGVLMESGECMLFYPAGEDQGYLLSYYGEFVQYDTVFVSGEFVNDCDLAGCPDAIGCIDNNIITYCGFGENNEFFNGCGVLIQGADCVVFADANSDNVYQLTNQGDFQVGDSVYVVGFLTNGCQPACSDVDGCIMNFHIRPCVNIPPPPQFHGCGELVQGDECMLFVPFLPIDTLGGNLGFVLEHYGNFVAGDTVLVNGQIVNGCEFDCAEAIACIVDNTIESCQYDPPGIYIETCGDLVQGTDCVLFQPDNVLESFELSFYGGFNVGERVFVIGELQVGQSDCLEADGLIQVDSILTCPGGPGVGDTIDVCGFLVEEAGCLLFKILEMNAPLFELDYYGDYQAGAKVRVQGLLDPNCTPDCANADLCIINNTIDSCWNNYYPYDFADCGVLVESGGCILFKRNWDQALYQLADYGTFQIGDSVFVKGLFGNSCVPECNTADYCVIINQIEPCGSNLPDFYTGCGILLEDPTGCVYFHALNLDLDFVISDQGGFTVSDTIWIEGHVSECEIACGDAVGCIENYAVESCMGNPQVPIHACGELTDIDGCLYFSVPEFGDTLFILDDYGTYGDGDTVAVDGYQQSYNGDCPLAFIFIDNYAIGPCENIPPDTVGVPYAGAGMLVQNIDCLLFEPLAGFAGRYELENYGAFGDGDSVYVEGDLFIDCQSQCTNAIACIFDNTIISFSIPDSSVTSPTNLAVDIRNYPNPFNPATIISFELPQPSRVTLEVYNILGQKVETLIENETRSGQQEIEWNGDKYASGIYFYRLQTENEVITKKMSLSK